MIVPGGGFTPAGYWKNSKSNGKYLFPILAMSIVYKNKFMEKLAAFCNNQKAPMDGELTKKLYLKEWIVYAKQPFASAQGGLIGGPKDVFEYIGRFSHKIAISNHRIKNVQDSHVTFDYKDYADSGKQKSMTLTAVEFLRIFCLHNLSRSAGFYYLNLQKSGTMDFLHRAINLRSGSISSILEFTWPLHHRPKK